MLFLTAGPDRAPWIAEPSGDSRIVRFTMTGESTEFPIPTQDASVYGIAPGADGNLWFTEHNDTGISECSFNAIGPLAPTGEITEFSVKTQNSCPLQITSGPDGNLWFIEDAA